MRRRQGVITVYAGAAAVLLISVILALLESARFYALETAALRYADMAAEMTFSNYVRPLAERYGIFVCPWKGDALAEKFKGYFDVNASERGNSSRLLAMYCEAEKISSSSEIAPEESGWEYLTQQMVRSEKYSLGESAAEGIMDYFSGSDASEELEDAGNASSEMAGELAEEQENYEEESEEAQAGGESGQGDSGGESGSTGDDAGGAGAPDISEAKKKDPRKGISQLLKSGFMGFIMGDREISEKTIDLSDCSYSVKKGSALSLPVDFEDAEDAGNALEEEGQFLNSFLKEKEEDVLIDLYAFRRFRDMSGEKNSNGNVAGGSALQYETEFLIFGQNSDRRNLENTMRALMAVRTGLNLVYLGQDAEKQAAAAEAASVISLAFMIPYAEELIRLLINLCWASAEALNDCAILASGGKIPVMKDSASWRLTYEGLLEMAKTRGGPIGKDRDSRGLTYSQYLMILAAAVSREKLVVRMTQLMEKNIRLTEGYEKFYFRNSCIGAGFTLNIRMDPVIFGRTGAVRRKLETAFSYISDK